VSDVARDSDVANAEKLVTWFGSKLAYIPRWNCWYYFDGQRWRRDDSGVYVKRAAINTAKRLFREACEELLKAATDPEADVKKLQASVAWAAKSQSTPRIMAMVELVPADARICMSYEKLDQNPQLLVCKNGTVDLLTGEIRKSSHIDYMTKLAPANYRPTVEAPLWDAFLETVLPDENVRGFLQRFVGYALTGDVGERLFVVLYGGGRNGKSVFLRVIQEILGDYAVTAPNTLLMRRKGEAHPTEVATLHGARLAVTSELRKGHVFDEEAVKRLTGNDKLTTRKMREDFWDFTPTHKLMLACNHRPRVADTTDSFWDRFALVPFTQRIDSAAVNPRLVADLLKERDGILAWALAGLAAYRREGLSRPDAVKHATEAYREQEDQLAAFFKERTRVGDSNTKTTTKALMQALESWCRGINMFVPRPNDLAERLQEMGLSPTSDGKARGWRGIELLQVSEKPREKRGTDSTDGTDVKVPINASSEVLIGDQPESAVSGVSAVSGGKKVNKNNVLSFEKKKKG
jgi:putative DNA primase/helicase